MYEQGLTALHLLLREDAEEIAGLKGKHEKERTHNHWGSTNGELSFGGRRIQVSRPRVRSKSGEEASLPHFEAFREEDPLPERVLNQILVGVSTRNYESSLDKPAVVRGCNCYWRPGDHPQGVCFSGSILHLRTRL